MQRHIFLIDAPTPFAPLSEWKRFLAEVLELKKEHGPAPEIEEAIRERTK